MDVLFNYFNYSFTTHLYASLFGKIIISYLFAYLSTIYLLSFIWDLYSIPTCIQVLQLLQFI